MNWILFTWELRKKSRRRRWFYIQLRRALSKLPRKNWRKVGGSVYLVNEKQSHELRDLLVDFDGPELKWYEFRIKC